MASIRKRRRANGYVYQVDLRSLGGRRLTAETKEAAERLYAEKVKELSDGPVLVGDPNLTFGEYRKQWLERITAQGELRPRTIEIYRTTAAKHLSELDARKLRELRRAEINALLDRKRAAGLAKATVRIIRATLTRMLGDAVDEELLKTNPAIGGSRRRKGGASDAAERTKSIRPLNADEVHRLLQTTFKHESELYTFLLVLARTGLRPGEAHGLKWSDLNFDDRTINVERAVSRDGQIGPTKTGANRSVDMSLELRAALTSLYVEREKQALRLGWREVPEWVFVDRNGKLIAGEPVRKRCARLLRLAGITGHKVYDLRHSFISSLLASGAPLTYVAAQAGHKNPNTTLGWYARWIPSGDRSFVDRLDSGHRALLAQNPPDSFGTNLAPIAVKSREEGQNPTTVDSRARGIVTVGGRIE